MPHCPKLFHFCQIIPDDKKDGTFKVNGKVERLDDTTLSITELPLKKWTQDYKQFLELMVAGGDKTPPEIKDFKENHTECTVRFTVIADKEKIDAFEKDAKGLMGKFKLNGSLSTSNMNLFDINKRIVKYATPEDIMLEFFFVRLEFYVKRKAMLVKKLEREQRMLSNKARFVEEVCNGTLIVSNRKRHDLLTDLKQRGYETFAPNAKKTTSDDEDADPESDDDHDEDASDANLGKGYEYLLGMKIWSLTFEKAEALRAQLAEMTAELERLRATSPEQLWLNDLDAIEAAMEQRDADFAETAKNEHRAQKKNQQRQAKKKSARGKKKKEEWISDMETSTDDDEVSESEGPVAVSRKPIAKKPAAKKAAPKKASPKKAAPVAIPMPAANKLPMIAIASSGTTEASSKTVATKAAESDSDDLGESLMDRMKKKTLAVAPAAKQRATNTSKRPPPKMKEFEVDSDASEDDELDGLDVDHFVLASVTPAKGKKVTKILQDVKRVRGKPLQQAAASTIRPAPSASNSRQTGAVSNLEINSDAEDAPVQKAAPARARSGRAAAKAVVYSIESSDDDYEEDEGSDFD